MSSKKRKANTKSSKTEVLNDHRIGDSDIGYSNGLRCGAGNEVDKSSGTSCSGGDNGSASISSAFSPKLADSASVSPISVNSLSNQSRGSNRIAESESVLALKLGRSDLHQPYADNFGSPTSQKFPTSSVPSMPVQHGSDYFHAQYQRVGHNFSSGFHHQPHLSPPNAYASAPPFATHPYSQQSSFHQPMNQQSMRPRPQAQPALPSSYASSTPMLTQLLQYPTTKEKPLESGSGGDNMNSVKHIFGKKTNQWPTGPLDATTQNHLFGRMPSSNHNLRQDLQMSQSLPINNQFFQPLDAQQQTSNNSFARPPSSSSSSLNNHPSQSPEVSVSNTQDGERSAKSSQHKKKSGAKKSVKSRSRIKRRPDVTRQEFSSGDEKKDEGGDASDNSSSTEVYSQITPSSTPPSSPQPHRSSIDQNNSDEGHDKSHASGYAGNDLSRFHSGPNNGGGFQSPGPLARQPTPYQGQPPFVAASGQSVRHNPQPGNFYGPFQTSVMAPSKPAETDAYGVFKPGPSYLHQQGTISGHHGSGANSNFNAFVRPGINGPSTPYPGASDASHQSAGALPYYRHPNHFQGKSEPPYGGRPEFFQSLPNHSGFAGGYPYDVPGYRPELGYRHPGDVYRQEGPYQPFPGYRPDGSQYVGYRLHSQEGRTYRHPEHPNQRHQDASTSNSGEYKLGENNSGNHGILPRALPDKSSSQQGSNCTPSDGSVQKQAEGNIEHPHASPNHSLAHSGKNNFQTTRMNNQWVTSMQGMMSGGSVVETSPPNEHGHPVVSLSSVKQMIGDTFDAPNKDISSQHENFGKNHLMASHDGTDANKALFQHTHISRPANSDFYHNQFRESPDGRLSDGRSDNDAKPRNRSGNSKIDFKLKSSERVSSKTDLTKQDIYSPSLTPSNHVSMSPASQNEFETFSPTHMPHQKFSNNPAFLKICEMGQEPDRGSFLDRLFSFMHHRGTPITAVPMICKQTIDLYSLYFLVRERGGMIEVTKNKKWRDVSSALSLGSSSSAGFTLKRNYGKYIYPYECKFDRGDIDPAPFLATLEISGSKKEVGKKSSTERIQAASDVDNNSASNSYHDDKDSAYFGRGTASPGSYGGECGDDSLSQHPPPYSGRPLQSPEYSIRPFHNSERFDMISPHHEVMDGSYARYPVPPPSYRYKHLNDQCPPQFDQRRVADNSGDGYLSHHGGFWSPPHPPQPFAQPGNYPFYGPPPGHFGQGPFPSRFSARADVERTQRFSSMGCPSGIRMFSFPLGSVESLRTKPVKRKRLCQRDIGSVDPWRLLMSLKSGLLCEATWALDVLMILTRDDQTHSSICLSNMPGMMEALVEHFKRSLISIFPKSKEQFEDLEISSEVQSHYHNQLKEPKVEGAEDYLLGGSYFHIKPSEISEIVELAIQKGKKQMGVQYSNKLQCKEVLEDYRTKEWDCYKHLESSSFDWQMGRSDTSMHIVAAVADITETRSDKESEICKSKFFGRKRLSLLSQISKKSFSCNVGDYDLKEDKNVSTVHLKEEMDVNSNCDKALGDEIVEQRNSPRDLKPSGNVRNQPINFEDKEDQTIESSLCNRNASLIKEMADINSFGIDGCMSATFSCSQIEAIVASCLGDRAIIPTEAKHDKEFKRIKRKRETSVVAWDEETLLPDDGPLCSAGESRRELTSRCLCISTILRNLSFVPSNDIEMSKHCGLIIILGKLLRLRHHHSLRELSGRSDNKSRDEKNCADESRKEDLIPSLEKFTDEVVFCSEDVKNRQVPSLEMPDDLVMWKDEKKEDDDCDHRETYEAWWWPTVDALRENALVIFANVSGQLDLSVFPEEICIPVLDGLLHWMVCQVGNQDDEENMSPYSNPHFYVVQHSSLSFRRLVLEALCKLCILDSNVDLLLAVPPFSRILLLFTRLVSLFEERQPLVVREMAIGLLSRLVPADPVVARALALHRSFVPSIIDFLEASIDGRISTHDASHHNPHYPFHPNLNANTSVDVLHRVATILRHISEVPENEPLITRHEQRLLHLVTSPALNRTVASVLSSVLALCS